jgi:UDP-glucose 4-epimerase
MAILITGGAGYIGSHMVALLNELGEDTVVIDNLSTGFKKAVKAGKLYVGDLRDDQIMNQLFVENDISGVIHFAADSIVAESVIDPLKYYDNNVYATSRLLHHMINHGVKYIVFSSTAATYGNSGLSTISESSVTVPESPYGETKLAIEKMMNWVSKSYGINYTSLRYFNACGAHKSGLIGEVHQPETHLIPLILQVALGKRKSISIYGDDYKTADGTCIRDYVHVTDLCKAHYLALQIMKKEHINGVYNLGSGKGYSVKEMIEIAKKVTKVDIEAEITNRREGDPDILIASNQLAKEKLKWEPEIIEIEQIIKSAWKFMKNYPEGYGG